jgi:hypothetical protein
MDLHPKVVSNHDMGLVFEELIRKFAESSNETAASTSPARHRAPHHLAGIHGRR